MRWLLKVGWKHLILWAMVAFALFPLLYVLSASLNPAGTLVGSNRLFSSVDFSNYVELFSSSWPPFVNWFFNTLFIGLITATCTVFLGAMAAYAFSRMRFKGRRVGLLMLMLIQMFPQFLAFVAIYMLLGAIGDVFPALGLGSRIGLILVYLGGALGVNTYLMYGYLNTVPIGIDEAARIDGASHAQVFFRIILRLVTPILAVVALLSFIAVTGDYVIASIVLTDPEKQTLAVGLYGLISQQFSKNWGLFSAGAVVASLPVMVVFFLLQKHIVGGLTSGAVK